jgi:5-methylcytosine-specific restriction endonuclease McrA
MKNHAPDCAEQIVFLRHIQALLEDGEFVATYKYALLHALCDLSVESNREPDGTLRVSLTSVAGKFIEYYWRQSGDYFGGGRAGVLRQNDGGQAAIVSRIAELRSEYETATSLRRDPMKWGGLVRFVARKIQEMPLFRLQTMVGETKTFLYENQLVDGSVVLKPGVAFCLAQFHALITGLARDHWMRKVTQITANRALLGTAADLEDFLFGAERQALARQATALADLQHGECFYCHRSLRGGSTHVDHFLPWSLYRLDTLPNLVAADADCNARKRDWLASSEHLARWRERNASQESTLARIAGYGLEHDQRAIGAAAYWAYDRAVGLGQSVWLKDRLFRLAGEEELLALRE